MIKTFSVNSEQDSKILSEFEQRLLEGFKTAGKFKEKVFFQENIYNIRYKKDPGQNKDGQFGRERLVNDILKNVKVETIRDNIHLLSKSPKEFLNSLKSKEVKDNDFLKYGHLFSEKYTRGCLNIFRWLLINKHQETREEDSLPISWKGKEVKLTDKTTQTALYRSLIRNHKNTTALRLALAFSQSKRYNSIDFEHMINSISWNYRNLTMNEKILDKDTMKELDVYSILKATVNFTLFLYDRKVKIFPQSWMCVPSSHRLGAYHLHRDVGNLEFQKYLKRNWSTRDFHKALKHGLITNPWEFIIDQWRVWKSNGQKDDRGRWDFINEVDVIIDRFSLTPIN